MTTTSSSTITAKATPPEGALFPVKPETNTEGTFNGHTITITILPDELWLEIMNRSPISSMLKLASICRNIASSFREKKSILFQLKYSSVCHRVITILDQSKFPRIYQKLQEAKPTPIIPTEHTIFDDHYVSAKMELINLLSGLGSNIPYDLISEDFPSLMLLSRALSVAKEIIIEEIEIGWNGFYKQFSQLSYDHRAMLNRLIVNHFCQIAKTQGVFLDTNSEKLESQNDIFTQLEAFTEYHIKETNDALVKETDYDLLFYLLNALGKHVLSSKLINPDSMSSFIRVIHSEEMATQFKVYIKKNHDKLDENLLDFLNLVIFKQEFCVKFKTTKFSKENTLEMTNYCLEKAKTFKNERANYIWARIMLNDIHNRSNEWYLSSDRLTLVYSKISLLSTIKTEILDECMFTYIKNTSEFNNYIVLSESIIQFLLKNLDPHPQNCLARAFIQLMINDANEGKSDRFVTIINGLGKHVHFSNKISNLIYKLCQIKNIRQLFLKEIAKDNIDPYVHDFFKMVLIANEISHEMNRNEITVEAVSKWVAKCLETTNSFKIAESHDLFLSIMHQVLILPKLNRASKLAIVIFDISLISAIKSDDKRNDIMLQYFNNVIKRIKLKEKEMAFVIEKLDERGKNCFSHARKTNSTQE